MIIKVTKKHIKEGYKTVTSTTLCPIARAFKSSGFLVDNVGATSYLWNKKSINLPKSAVRFIERMCENYDNCLEMKNLKPFSFRIKDPRKK